MHPRRSALVVVAALALTTLSTIAPAAAADARVSTDPTGAHVVLVRNRIWVEVGPRRGGGAGETGGCRRRWVPAAAPFYLRKSRLRGDIRPVPMPPAPSEAHVPYHVYCDGDYITSVWLTPSQFQATPPVDPRAMAERLARDLPYPPATIGVSPAARGLTGLESWFWVDGSRGPISDAVEGFGLLVEVEAWPAAATWDFGDGSGPQRGSLGQPAPGRSEVRHAYERRSRGAPFTVRATVRLDVRWRQNGGPWEPLPPVFRTATRAYPVAESRSVLISP